MPITLHLSSYDCRGRLRSPAQQAWAIKFYFLGVEARAKKSLRKKAAAEAQAFRAKIAAAAARIPSAEPAGGAHARAVLASLTAQRTEALATPPSSVVRLPRDRWLEMRGKSDG